MGEKLILAHVPELDDYLYQSQLPDGAIVFARVPPIKEKQISETISGHNFIDQINADIKEAKGVPEGFIGQEVVACLGIRMAISFGMPVFYQDGKEVIDDSKRDPFSQYVLLKGSDVVPISGIEPGFSLQAEVHSLEGIFQLSFTPNDSFRASRQISRDMVTYNKLSMTTIVPA